MVRSMYSYIELTITTRLPIDLRFINTELFMKHPRSFYDSAHFILEPSNFVFCYLCLLPIILQDTFTSMRAFVVL
jgi:hypothetical protein